MISRFAPLAFLAALLLSSCGGSSGLAVVPKSRIGGYAGVAGGSDYTTASPSPHLVQQMSGRPTDKHGMPYYKVTDRQRVVRTTAYTCTEDDHLEYGSNNAAGTPLRYSNRVRSAAADWAVYPVGTVFRIKGMPQLFVVDDYGSALVGTATIDIYTPSKAHMAQWGRRNVEISVVQWGSYRRSAELLAKRRHFSHCNQMYVAIERLTGGVATASR